MAVDQLNSLIQKGRKGKNIGISTGCAKLDAVINGIQKKYMYVVAADQGSGNKKI